MWPRPCPPGCGCSKCRPQCSYLPISTGNVGLSMTTGIVEQYGHNYRGTGIGLFKGYCTQWRGGVPYWGAGSCGAGGFGGQLAAVLTGKCGPYVSPAAHH